MSITERCVGITGAAGFIGRRLVGHFAEAGWSVRAYRRPARIPDEPPHERVRWVPFVMPDGFDDADFAGLEWLIHGAVQPYGPRHRDADEVNRASAERLIRMARAQGTRIVFLSTLSAHEEARSHYGRSKLALESLFEPERDTVLRLGLVMDRSGGLFGDIVTTLRRARVVPLPDGGRQPIQILSMDDLLRVVRDVLEHGRAGRFEVAHPEVYRIRDIYREVMRATGAHPLLVPVPLALVAPVVAAFERLGIPTPVTSENVLGLKHMRVFDTAPSLARLGIETRGLRETVKQFLERG